MVKLGKFDSQLCLLCGSLFVSLTPCAIMKSYGHLCFTIGLRAMKHNEIYLFLVGDMCCRTIACWYNVVLTSYQYISYNPQPNQQQGSVLHLIL